MGLSEEGEDEEAPGVPLRGLQLTLIPSSQEVEPLSAPP